MSGIRADADLRIGGIALKNGLALVSERYWAAAIREVDGTISVASGQKARLPGSGGPRPGATRAVSRAGRGGAADPGPAGSTAAGPAEAPVGAASGPSTAGRAATSERASGFAGAGIPLVRGLSRFGESLLVLALVKSRLPHAELPLEGARVAAALAGSMVATSAVRAVTSKSAVAEEVGTVLAAFVPAVLALKDSPISGYHGAEHKVIGGREAAVRAAARARENKAGIGAGVETGAETDIGVLVAGDSAAAAKEHDRCGSNLVGPYLLATIATNLIARGRSGRKSPVVSAAAGAASLGIALETLRWANKHADSVVARLLLSPGRVIQKRLTTTEPTPEQLEVGERALAELLRLERAGA